MALANTRQGLYIPRVKALSDSNPQKTLDKGVTDPYPQLKSSVPVLVNLIMAVHRQLEYKPYFEPMVYNVQLRRLSKDYNLDDIRNAILLAAKGCKAGFGIKAIKANLNTPESQKNGVLEQDTGNEPFDILKEYGLT